MFRSVPSQTPPLSCLTRYTSSNDTWKLLFTNAEIEPNSPTHQSHQDYAGNSNKPERPTNILLLTSTTAPVVNIECFLGPACICEITHSWLASTRETCALSASTSCIVVAFAVAGAVVGLGYTGIKGGVTQRRNPSYWPVFARRVGVLHLFVSKGRG